MEREPASFDLVQIRHSNDFLLGSQWSQVVRECVRVTRPGGCVRLIECSTLGTSTGASVERMAQVLHEAWRDDLPAICHAACRTLHAYV